MLARFAARHRVIRYDQRGFGSAPAQEPGWDPGEDLLDVLERSGAGPAHLVGNSLGATVARWTAATHPERVRSITLVGPGLAGTPTTPEDEAGHRAFAAARSAGDLDATMQIARRLFLVSDAEVELVRDTLARHRPAPGRQSDPDEYAPERVRVPALVVVGSDDAPVVVAASRALSERIPGARLVVIEGARHHPQLTHAEAFAGPVLEFLTAVDAAE